MGYLQRNNMAIKFVLLVLFFPILSFAKTIKVAVLDTGYYINNNSFKSCENHKLDFNSTPEFTMDDLYPHGQNIVHIIVDGLQNLDYCIIVIKTMSKTYKFDAIQYNTALSYVLNLKPDIINMSFTGGSSNTLESILIKAALDKGIKIVASAGNDSLNLTDKNCNVFPACIDKRIYVVGSVDKLNKKSSFTNYGERVNFYEMGENVVAGGLTQSGTSQATAKKTNKLIREMAK